MGLLLNGWFLVRLYSHAIWEIMKQVFRDQFFSVKSIKKQDRDRWCASRSNQTVIVTGGTGGLGLKISERLKEMGLNVIVASTKPPPESSAVRSDFLFLDLTSKQSVIRFVRDFKKKYKCLHYLINNAGAMFLPYEHTDFGVEGHMSVNFLGHAVLTELLLPSLRASVSTEFTPLITNVSSSTNCLASPHQVLRLLTKSDPHDFSTYVQYPISKLAVKMYSYALARRFEDSNCDVKVISLHPGLVDSGLFKGMNPLLLWFKDYIGGPLLMWSCEYAADWIVELVLERHQPVKAGCYVADTRALTVFDGTTDLTFAKNSELLYDKVQNDFVRPICTE